MIKSLKTRKWHKLNKQEIFRYWISFEDLIYVQLIFYVQGGQLLEAAIQRQSQVLKIRSKFTGEHPCRSAISIKMLCSSIQIALWHGCSLVNLLHIFITSFPKNTSVRLLLNCGVRLNMGDTEEGNFFLRKLFRLLTHSKTK